MDMYKSHCGSLAHGAKLSVWAIAAILSVGAIFPPYASAQRPPAASVEAGEAAKTTTGRFEQTHTITFDNAGYGHDIVYFLKGFGCLSSPPGKLGEKITIPAWQVTYINVVDSNNWLGGCSDEIKGAYWTFQVADHSFDIGWVHDKVDGAFKTRVDLAKGDIDALAGKGVTITATCVDGSTNAGIQDCLNNWTETSSEGIPGVTIRIKG